MSTQKYQMVQYKLVDGEYIRIGVWTMPVDRMGLDIEIDDAYVQEQGEANWVINRLVEADAFPLPDDFLEYWQENYSPYQGMMGKIESH